MNHRGFAALIIIGIIALVLISGIGGYYAWKKQNTPQTQSQTFGSTAPAIVNAIATSTNPGPDSSSAVDSEPKSPSPRYPGNYDVVLKQNADCSNANTYAYCKADVYLKDQISGKEVFFLTIDNVNNDSRTPIYRNGNLFIIKRFIYNSSPSGDSYTDELWMYGAIGQSKKIYSSPGFTYKVNNDGSLVAIVPADSMVRIIDTTGNVATRTYNLSSNSCVIDTTILETMDGPDLMMWADGNAALWGDFSGMFGVVGCFWRISIPRNAITYYQIASGLAEAMGNLNPEKMVAVYSDRTDLGDNTSTQQSYSLYLYSVTTKQSTRIATLPHTFSDYGIVKGWITPTQLVYSTPSGDKTYNLTQ